MAKIQAVPPEHSADVFDKVSENEIVVLFFLVVFLLIMGIILTMVQCRRLKQTMIQQRQWKQQQEWNSVSARLGGGGTTRNVAQEVRSARNMDRQSLQSLQSEIQGLKEIQQNVHSQISTLEKYVAMKTGEATMPSSDGPRKRHVSHS